MVTLPKDYHLIILGDRTGGWFFLTEFYQSVSILILNYFIEYLRRNL